jgi:hypothetical protein
MWYYQSSPEELFQFVENNLDDTTAATGERALDTIANLPDLSKHLLKFGTSSFR